MIVLPSGEWRSIVIVVMAGQMGLEFNDIAIEMSRGGVVSREIYGGQHVSMISMVHVRLCNPSPLDREHYFLRMSAQVACEEMFISLANLLHTETQLLRLALEDGTPLQWHDPLDKLDCHEIRLCACSTCGDSGASGGCSALLPVSVVHCLAC